MNGNGYQFAIRTAQSIFNQVNSDKAVTYQMAEKVAATVSEKYTALSTEYGITDFDDLCEAVAQDVVAGYAQQ